MTRGFELAMALAVGVFVGAGACGSSTGAKGDGGTGTGGTGGGNVCTNTGPSTCTQTEINTYNNCIQSACASDFSTCYGPGYKTGTYGGPCASYMQCQAACGCTDTACRMACTIPSACQSCQLTLANCTLGASCTIPACFLSGVDGGFNFDAGLGFDAGNATCTDLTACCNAITDAQLKSGCMTVVNVGNNQLCSATLGSYQQGGLCP